MGKHKRDAEKIIAHIEYIKKQPWLTKSQGWWPDYLFHFTDLANAVKILSEGMLLCRSQLEEAGALATDIASPEIIASTASKWKDYVRLYFRPRTPMQYRNEGFRPVNQRELGGAHCPVPIVFLFDAKEVLTDQATLFSDGNLAAGAQVRDTAAFFLSLPFEKIYHDASLWGLSEGDKRNVIFHRHAEVVIPQSLNLASLKFICCRSQAEFETFFHLLPGRVRQKWGKKISIGQRALLFYAYWSFVEKADLSTSAISFTFNPSRTPGPFHAKLEIREVNTDNVYVWERGDFYAREPQVFDLSNMTRPEDYVVKFWLDGYLAYQNRFLDESELPF